MEGIFGSAKKFYREKMVSPEEIGPDYIYFTFTSKKLR